MLHSVHPPPPPPTPFCWGTGEPLTKFQKEGARQDFNF